MTVKLHHRIDGSGARVLLLHAVGIDLTFLDAVADVLAKEFTVIPIGSLVALRVVTMHTPVANRPSALRSARLSNLAMLDSRDAAMWFLSRRAYRGRRPIASLWTT